MLTNTFRSGLGWLPGHGSHVLGELGSNVSRNSRCLWYLCTSSFFVINRLFLTNTGGSILLWAHFDHRLDPHIHLVAIRLRLRVCCQDHHEQRVRYLVPPFSLMN